MDVRQFEAQRDALLDTIINQAQALRDGKVTSRSAAVALLVANVDTLRAWEESRNV